MVRNRIWNTIQLFAFGVLLFHGSNGIPINLANNRNSNYNENHANRPLPNQAQQLHSRPPQPGYSKGPEMEEIGRFHTNQNHFRRHAMLPPDVKPGQGFYPPEQHGKGGNNFYQGFEEPVTNHLFRHNHLPQQNEGQGENRQQHHPNDMRHRHMHQQDAHQPPTFNNFHHREEPQLKHGHEPDSFFEHEHQARSGGPLGKFDNHVNPSKPYSANIPAHPIPSYTTDVGGTNPSQSSSFPLSPAKLSSLPPLTAVTMILQAADGRNSTFIIEYDVSDHDSTYETTVEVDDGNDL